MRSLVVCATIIGLAVPVLADSNRRSVQKAHKLVMEGHRQLAKNDVARASVAFEEALRLVPDLPDGHAGLGGIAMLQKNYEGAAHEFEAARAAYERLGEQLKDSEYGRYIDAQHQTMGIRNFLDMLWTPAVKGLTPAEKTMMELNLSNALHQAELVEPPDRRTKVWVPPVIYFLLGNAQFHLERIDDARANWETCARLAPKFAPVFNNLAVVYYKAARFADAQANLQRAEELGLPVNPQFKQQVTHALDQGTRTSARSAS